MFQRSDGVGILPHEARIRLLEMAFSTIVGPTSAPPVVGRTVASIVASPRRRQASAKVTWLVSLRGVCGPACGSQPTRGLKARTGGCSPVATAMWELRQRACTCRCSPSKSDSPGLRCGPRAREVVEGLFRVQCAVAIRSARV